MSFLNLLLIIKQFNVQYIFFGFVLGSCICVRFTACFIRRRVTHILTGKTMTNICHHDKALLKLVFLPFCDENSDQIFLCLSKHWTIMTEYLLLYKYKNSALIKIRTNAKTSFTKKEN